jgi:hypothetical protein
MRDVRTGVVPQPAKDTKRCSDLRQDGVMAADRYRTAGGWSIEVVRLIGTPDKHDGEWLRVCYYGYHVADVRTVAEIERWVCLAELKLDTLRPARAVIRRDPEVSWCGLTAR